jgi:opacity protein-like surface antigen
MAMGDDLAPGGGMSLSFPVMRRVTLEAEASLGRDAARSGLSVLLDVFRLGAFTTYAAAGVGVQRDEIDEELAGGAWNTVHKKTEFALGIGAGTIVPVGARWSYRVDFRWYNPKAEWPESWRLYNGVSLRLAGPQ